jgi:hypothetical protein
VVDGFEVGLRTPNIMLYTDQLVISGGKSTAATIETDTEFKLVHAQLLASKKNTKDITVFVSIDTDEMDAFRVRKRVSIVLIV